MRKLAEFIRTVYVAVLFVLLELIALNYYARSTAYTEARLLVQSNRVVGGLHRAVTGVGNFFSLGRENRQLTRRIAQLEEQLAHYEEAAIKQQLADELTMLGSSKYHMLVASVVSNSVGRARNYILLNRGRGDGVLSGMAVTTPEGAIAGYVVDCSERYAVAVSILSRAFRASGSIEGGNHYGSLSWDERSPHHVLLEELPKYAEPKAGDRIVTTGFEPYFPKGMLIGTVEEATLDEVGTSYTVRVRLAADLTTMNNLVLIENLDLAEIEQLQQSETIREIEKSH